MKNTLIISQDTGSYILRYHIVSLLNSRVPHVIYAYGSMRLVHISAIAIACRDIPEINSFMIVPSSDQSLKALAILQYGKGYQNRD